VEVWVIVFTVIISNCYFDSEYSFTREDDIGFSLVGISKSFENRGFTAKLNNFLSSEFFAIKLFLIGHFALF